MSAGYRGDLNRPGMVSTHERVDRKGGKGKGYYGEGGNAGIHEVYGGSLKNEDMQRSAGSSSQLCQYFIREYYTRLNRDPDKVSDLYSEDADMTWIAQLPAHKNPDKNMPCCLRGTGKDSIKRVLNSMKLMGCKSTLHLLECHEASTNSLIIIVRGDMFVPNEPVREFVQNFHVNEPMPRWFFIRNDMLIFLDSSFLPGVKMPRSVSAEANEKTELPSVSRNGNINNMSNVRDLGDSNSRNHSHRKPPVDGRKLLLDLIQGGKNEEEFKQINNGNNNNTNNNNTNNNNTNNNNNNDYNSYNNNGNNNNGNNNNGNNNNAKSEDNKKREKSTEYSATSYAGRLLSKKPDNQVNIISHQKGYAVPPEKKHPSGDNNNNNSNNNNKTGYDHQGDDDVSSPPLSSTILFVSEFPFNCSDTEIKQAVKTQLTQAGRQGRVVGVERAKDKSKRFGFIEMDSLHSASFILENGLALPSGCIRVRKATSGGARSSSKSASGIRNAKFNNRNSEKPT